MRPLTVITKAPSILGMRYVTAVRVVTALVIGLAGAAGAARLIQTLLFDVQPLDPAVYAGVAALFTAVAALACMVPSLRASRIDPLLALRAE